MLTPALLDMCQLAKLIAVQRRNALFPLEMHRAELRLLSAHGGGFRLAAQRKEMATGLRITIWMLLAVTMGFIRLFARWRIYSVVASVSSSTIATSGRAMTAFQPFTKKV